MPLTQNMMRRLIVHTPVIVMLLVATSVSMNMISSVTSKPGLVFALCFAVSCFASILIHPIPMKYILAAIAMTAFFSALSELTFDKLISVMYLSLVYLAFLLPSPLPVAFAAGCYLYFTPSYSPEIPAELILTIQIGAVVNAILYSLLAFYFRNLKRENKINGELNDQLQTAHDKLEHMAYYDSITQLPNRELLHKRMAEALETETPMAVMFLDLDNFKNVNDMMGHHAGDLLLRDVAAHLRNVLDESSFISRYAGDEFVLLVPYKLREEIELLAHRLIYAFRTPFEIQSNSIYSTPSIGISLYPEDSRDAETLILYADKAMYEVKRNEKNGFRFYSSSWNSELFVQVKLENDIRSALSKRQFTVYYQPMVELESGTISGVEALLRWIHPELGPIAPSTFIPLAERTGVIVELGEWVLEEACRQVKVWQMTGHPDLTLAVNISIRQFRLIELAASVSRILDATGFEPALLELEVTESLMQNFSQSTAILDELKQLGVNISIDDFGTGYSSLSVLRHMPVDLLKIDRSFTRELTTEAASASIVKLIIDIGHSMNLKVVCEGIEHADQVPILRQYGCEIGQGYHYHRPASSEEIGLLLNSANTTH